MLLEIKALLRQRGGMNLRDLAIHFHTDPSALEPILEELCRTGVVRRIETDKPGPCDNCPGCSHAAEGTIRWYELIENRGER